MKRIAVLTSGGDGPGLNPCIRAVTRMAIHMGVEVIGVRRGVPGPDQRAKWWNWTGGPSGGVMGYGGTFLGTARCPEFQTEKGAGKHCAPSTGWI